MITRTNKLAYYAGHILGYLLPRGIYENALGRKLAGLHRFDRNQIAQRVDYYNRMSAFAPPGLTSLKELPLLKKPRTYHLDAFEFTRYFRGHYRANFIVGDVRHTEPVPTFQKARPIGEGSANGLLLKLNKTRHFIFLRDRKSFRSKKNTLIGRGVVRQEHRVRFLDMYFDHPLCDLGQVNKEGGNERWIKRKISRRAHLDHKFILSLEGNDVASNLKWIMSSNSIAVMPKPKFETWFMEGRLIPDHHYICVKEDYSDLEEKLQYYIDHPEAAEAIIENAHRHVAQFHDLRQEELISLLVLQKYFYYTGQSERYELLPEAQKFYPSRYGRAWA